MLCTEGDGQQYIWLCSLHAHRVICTPDCRPAVFGGEWRCQLPGGSEALQE